MTYRIPTALHTGPMIFAPAATSMAYWKNYTSTTQLKDNPDPIALNIPKNNPAVVTRGRTRANVYESTQMSRCLWMAAET